MSERPRKVVLVTGQRTWTDRDFIFATLDLLNPDIVIDGAAEGADTFAHEWATEHLVQNERFLPNWKKWGNFGGAIRNAHMIHALTEYRDQGCECIVVAFLNEPVYGPGSGTRNCIQQAKADGFRVLNALKWTPAQESAKVTTGEPTHA